MVRTAIVTGASRGIGKAIATRLAADGNNVALHDLPQHRGALTSLADSLRAQHAPRQAKFHVHTSDIAQPDAAPSLVSSTVSALGPIHTMIANAGICQVKPLLDLTLQDWEAMMSVNVYAVHNCFAAAVRQFLAQGAEENIRYPTEPPTVHPPARHGEGGTPLPSRGTYKLIAGCSTAAMKPFPLISHYCTSKWAVRGLTQGYASTFAQNGITCNGYAPGIVGTNMWEEIDEGLVKAKGGKKGDYVKKYTEEMVALGRTSVPEDVANFVSFLAGGDSDYMTGQTVVVDGGIVYT